MPTKEPIPPPPIRSTTLNEVDLAEHLLLCAIIWRNSEKRSDGLASVELDRLRHAIDLFFDRVENPPTSPPPPRKKG
jgi:hypothetical protein